jgi:hypothetical protein
MTNIGTRKREGLMKLFGVTFSMRCNYKV